MKQYITYDEKLALRLQRKYGLTDGTLRVWKHRGGIPARYGAGYKNKERASKAQMKKITAFLAKRWVNRSGFEGIPGYRLNDLMRDEKRKSLSLADAEQILAARNQLRRLMRAVIAKKQLKDLSDLLALPYVRPMLLMGTLKDYGRLRGKSKSLKGEDWDWILEILEKRIEN